VIKSIATRAVCISLVLCGLGVAAVADVPDGRYKPEHMAEGYIQGHAKGDPQRCNADAEQSLREYWFMLDFRVTRTAVMLDGVALDAPDRSNKDTIGVKLPSTPKDAAVLRVIIMKAEYGWAIGVWANGPECQSVVLGLVKRT